MMLRKGPEMQYNVIRSMDDSDLIRKVNAAITEGWIPQGGVTIASFMTVRDIIYFQAMVKPLDN